MLTLDSDVKACGCSENLSLLQMKWPSGTLLLTLQERECFEMCSCIAVSFNPLYMERYPYITNSQIEHLHIYSMLQHMTVCVLKSGCVPYTNYFSHSFSDRVRQLTASTGVRGGVPLTVLTRLKPNQWRRTASSQEVHQACVQLSMMILTNLLRKSPSQPARSSQPHNQ